MHFTFPHPPRKSLTLFCKDFYNACLFHLCSTLTWSIYVYQGDPGNQGKGGPPGLLGDRGLQGLKGEQGPTGPIGKEVVTLTWPSSWFLSYKQTLLWYISLLCSLRALHWFDKNIDVSMVLYNQIASKQYIHSKMDESASRSCIFHDLPNKSQEIFV